MATNPTAKIPPGRSLIFRPFPLSLPPLRFSPQRERKRKTAAMASDEELVEKLREVLGTADLATTTTADIRRMLEEHFGMELSGKKAFIREQVNLFVEESQAAAENDGEAEEEDEDEEEGSGKKGSGKKKNAKRTGGGFTKLCSLSPQLQNFVGESELPRTQVVKRMWAYIRENNLQDPKNKRRILCDEKLHELFNIKTIDMFQMNKALARHIWPLGSENAPPAKTKEKSPKEENEEVKEDELPRKEKRRKTGSPDELPGKEKRRKTGSSGFLTPITLSDALVKFIGTGESALPRSDVVKRMWSYIKENNLQDPSDKRQIICDEKLKELLEVDSFNGFTVSKLLAPHFIKSEQ